MADTGNGKAHPTRVRVKRNMELIMLARRGVTPEALAVRFEMSPVTVRRIIKEWRDEQPELGDIEPLEIVEETLQGYTAAIEELAEYALDSGGNTAAKIGAVRVRLEALKGRLELLQGLGVVPHELGTLRLAEDWVRVARLVIQVLEAWGVPEQVQVAIIDAVEGREPELPEGKRIIELEAE